MAPTTSWAGPAMTRNDYGGKGNDYLDGQTGDYNQVDYDGAAGDYTFTRNADGTVTVVSAGGECRLRHRYAGGH